MTSDSQKKRIAGFWLSLLVLVVLFTPMLFSWLVYALHSDLESYIILIPFISAFFLFKKRGESRGAPVCAFFPAAIILSIACGLIGLHIWLVLPDGTMGEGNRLFLPMTAFVVFVTGLHTLFYTRDSLRHSLFPLLFLFAMVPLPECVTHGLKMSLQQWSAEAAHGMFFMTGTPVFRDGMVFNLPGLTIEVAEECSGIHSSLVLFITSILAGRIFLRKQWTRVVLVAVVLPLGVIRNGFRIVTISLLTIHVDPGIIHSPLHHRGGPIFFVLSFVVFLGVLWMLRRHEIKSRDRNKGAM